jgi:acetyl-CoA synthetase
MARMRGETFEFGGEIAWRPTADIIERSRLTAFMRRHGIADLATLLDRSVTDPTGSGVPSSTISIEFYEPFTQVVDLSRGPAWPRWCVGGRLNIVHNCLHKWAGTATDNLAAIRWEGEEGVVCALTYAELRAATNRCANALRELGVRKGDRVALFLPMGPELAAAFFAIPKIGAVVLPLFSGYGADAVAARLQDAEATVLITADGFWRRGSASK